MMISGAVLWAVLGLVLMIAEIFSGAFILLFFGISALLVALIKKLSGLESLPAEIMIFSVLGIADLLLLRKKFLASLQSARGHPAPEERKLILNTDIGPRGMASISYQGTTWTALNDSDVKMKKDETVIIDRTEGIKLVLKPL